ncbi:MAG: hypothetical protein WA705_24185 [Candidatus Ozemobacteraceae bacterium]
MSLHNTQESTHSPMPSESSGGVLVNIVLKITATIVLVGGIVWATM